MAAFWFMHMMHVNRKPHLLKIEYARSSRSQCKWLLGCDKIAEGDLRIGVVHDTWPWTQWFHFDCFWGDDFEEFYKNNRGKVIGVDIEDLMDGYRSISEDDQQKAVESLEEWIDICKAFYGGDEDEDEDYGNSVATEVENQAETSGNNGNGNNENKENVPNNQNGNKTPGNDNNGNVINKENLPNNVNQNGNKTPGNDNNGNVINKTKLPNNQNGNKTPGNDNNGNVKNKENMPKVQNGNKISGKDEKKVLITKRVAETSTVNQGLKRAIDPVPKVPEKKIRMLNSFVGFL
ncbi:probable serine/threonine-protein kinase DDB_G0282963 [Mytilus edulis]|uniref:probable serine/threonine-protein kinase DDB_G0282963 n=1 Tax=Mytilus edulis TaxID=6550 RepID=UPI0039EF9EFA